MENFGPLLLTPGELTQLPPPLTHQVRSLLLTNDSPYMVEVKGGANGGSQVHIKPYTTQMFPLVRNEFTGMTAQPYMVSAGLPATNGLWGSWLSPTDQVPGVYPHPHYPANLSTLAVQSSSFTINGAAYGAAITRLNPVARWQFNDPVDSTTIADTGATGTYTGTVVGGVTLDYPITVGMDDIGATFDGTSGYVTIPPTPVNDAIVNQSSYAVLTNLILPVGAPGGVVFYSQTSPTNAGSGAQPRLQVPAAALTWVIGNPTTQTVFSGPATVNDGMQHQVAVGVEDLAGTFYFDGAPAGTFTLAAPQTPAVLTAGIGQWLGGASWLGAIGDLMILPGITAAQAASLYVATNPQIAPPVPSGALLVGYSYRGAPPNTPIVWYSGGQVVWQSISDAYGQENVQLTTPIPLTSGPLSVRVHVPPGSTPTAELTGTILWSQLPSAATAALQALTAESRAGVST